GLVVFVAGLIQSSQPRDAAIEGIVVTVGTERPVSGAQVWLYISEKPGSIVFQTGKPDGSERTVFTDRNGRFKFEELAAGGYQIKVAGNGFVRNFYGARPRAERGRTFNLAAGQRLSDVVISVAAASAVSGRVVATTGDAIEGISVQLLRISYDSDGER